MPAAVTGQAVVDDTHRALAELRAVCPVSQIAPDTWFVTTPGEAFRVLDDVGSFSGLHDGGPPPAQRTLFQSTPEDHAIRRRIMAGAISTGRVVRVAPYARQQARLLVQGFLCAGAPS